MQTSSTAPETPFGLCRLIGQIRGEIVLGIEQALTDAGVGLNFSQFLALKRLGENGPMAPGELARSLNYNPGALTRLLDKLEHLGYLQRVPDPNDRRALRLELTAAGSEIRKRMLACSDAAAERAFTDVSDAEQRALHHLLTRVLEHLHAERDCRAGS
ncbi:MAG: MarR family transcriptional regulator [Rhodanobacteraceae bacterium]|nr:MAG: MarR family transcriptional regulator [Rhodanobacteraceae bacterium]